MNRRNFIGGIAGILASGFAPAIGHAGILMPVKKIAEPEPLWGVSPVALPEYREMQRIINAMQRKLLDNVAIPEHYTLIVHPEWARDLRNASDFVPVEKYAAMKPLRGEVGCLALDREPYARIISQAEIYN